MGLQRGAVHVPFKYGRAIPAVTVPPVFERFLSIDLSAASCDATLSSCLRILNATPTRHEAEET